MYSLTHNKTLIVHTEIVMWNWLDSLTRQLVYSSWALVAAHMVEARLWTLVLRASWVKPLPPNEIVHLSTALNHYAPRHVHFRTFYTEWWMFEYGVRSAAFVIHADYLYLVEQTTRTARLLLGCLNYTSTYTGITQKSCCTIIVKRIKRIVTENEVHNMSVQWCVIFPTCHRNSTKPQKEITKSDEPWMCFETSSKRNFLEYPNNNENFATVALFWSNLFEFNSPGLSREIDKQLQTWQDWASS